jgi:hypothetical protein
LTNKIECAALEKSDPHPTQSWRVEEEEVEGETDRKKSESAWV